MSLSSEMAERAVQHGAITCDAANASCGKGCGWQSALGLLARWLRAQCSVGSSLAAERSALAVMLVLASAEGPQCRDGRERSAAECQSLQRRDQRLQRRLRMAVGVGTIGQMVANTVPRGNLTGDAAISVGGEAGDLQLALSLFAGMAESVVQRNAIRCSAAISACIEGCGWPLALGPLARWLRTPCRVGTPLATPRSALAGRLMICNRL